MEPALPSSSESESHPNSTRLSRAEAIHILTSETFREVLQEVPAGIDRSKRLRVVAKVLFDDAQRSKSLSSLNHAIQYAREALEELPLGHAEIPSLADTFIFYAQTKAIFSPSVESTEEYIVAIQAVIEATRDSGVHTLYVQRLGWAYWARFELSKSDDDLEATITYITTKVKVLDDVLPNSNLVLGLALHTRFTRSQVVGDLHEAINLLETTLKDPTAAGEGRHIFLMNLVQYSVEGIKHGDAATGLARLIANAKLALPDLPDGAKKVYVQETLAKAENLLEMMQQRPALVSIFKELGISNLDADTAPAVIGKTHVPSELYAACPVGKDLIRTLELLPGKGDDEIICNIKPEKLDGNAQFEALSYTWGDLNQVTEITIGRSKCQVTTNLSNALRHLRSPDMPRILWVDAVCINQKDTDEKAQQVAMMGDIYQAASQVLVWIGAPPADSEGVPSVANGSFGALLHSEKLEWYTDNDISLMRQFFTNGHDFSDWPVIGALSTLTLLARSAHLNTLPFFQDPRYSDFNIGIYPSDLWQKSTKALDALLKSPYWSRVWVFQEMVLGRRVLIHYGRHILPLELFIDAEKAMREHYYGCCYEHCAAQSNNKWSALYSILKNLATIRSIGKMKSSRAMGNELSLFDTMLGGVDFRKATDPRDQVYGLLGLVSGHTEDTLLRPDYSLPVPNVYSRATCKIMQNDRSLRLLSYADRQNSVDDLPSWCHDFNGSSPFNPNPYFWDLFSAYSGERLSVELHQDAQLRVIGYHLDVIADSTEARTPESISITSLLRWIDGGLKLTLEKCATDEEEAYLHKQDIHVNEAFGRTLIGDTITCSDGSTRRAVFEDITNLFTWIEWARRDIPSGTRDWAARECPLVFQEISKSFLDRTQSRKLFTTKEGRMGTGVATVFGQEKEVSVGDHVFLLQGSNVPVILRSLTPESGAVTGHDSGAAATASVEPLYAFVGTAYVHGVMDGEACPPDDSFRGVLLSHYPKPPPAKNELMRDALRMSLLLGHGSADSSLGQTAYAPSLQENQNQDQIHETCGKTVAINAEALVFPDGRQWDESFKRIPAHRVLLSTLFQNTPTTEEGWQQLENEMATKMKEKQEGKEGAEETQDDSAPVEADDKQPT
ncbi:heterokaryon incompatibility protein-domain-containing protein [Xylaria bambusicola]|uniref:heterokaryon incompatibility protein-domain-containing protein n=1 Tax=Xylaria bambusicola TaxID=326684 RepID=UPI002008545C|nr:heterokaryon incompatibility protein-domain-containing protein [Xylaria bambusicola]KAI0517931.1 heterokaryon incompatibility protein-domain-containing protein [Xylaria bambusicola]